MSPVAVRRAANALVTSLALYWRNWLQEGLGRFHGTCSASDQHTGGELKH